ncbi:hypothetical protein T492DRAFT_1144200 [Pavlovales sp. CCMP2436]|nr:hypothetical protein T492DRAFT_1144200 [Pavlovales sp. CCMP2436]
MWLIGLLFVVSLLGALVYAAIRARDALLQALLRRLLLRVRVLQPTFWLRSRVSVEGLTLYLDGWDAHVWLAQWPFWPAYIFGCEVESMWGDSLEVLLPWSLSVIRIRCGTVVLRGTVPPNHQWMGGRCGAREYLYAGRAWRLRHLRHVLDEFLAGGPRYTLRRQGAARGWLLVFADSLMHRLRIEAELVEVLLADAPLGPASPASLEDSTLGQRGFQVMLFLEVEAAEAERLRGVRVWTEPHPAAEPAMVALVPTVVRLEVAEVEMLRAYDKTSPAMGAGERAAEREAARAAQREAAAAARATSAATARRRGRLVSSLGALSRLRRLAVRLLAPARAAAELAAARDGEGAEGASPARAPRRSTEGCAY